MQALKEMRYFLLSLFFFAVGIGFMASTISITADSEELLDDVISRGEKRLSELLELQSMTEQGNIPSLEYLNMRLLFLILDSDIDNKDMSLYGLYTSEASTRFGIGISLVAVALTIFSWGFAERLSRRTSKSVKEQLQLVNESLDKLNGLLIEKSRRSSNAEIYQTGEEGNHPKETE